MTKHWQKVEIAYLKKHAGDKSLAELAERFHSDAETVRAKLEELRLGAAAKAAKTGPDAVELYQEGLRALYGGDWERAAGLFEEVEREGYGELVARARQFAATARLRLAEEAPEDPWVRAVYEKNRGSLDEALALCVAERRAERDGRFAYLAAVLCALRGDLEAGRGHLARAVEIDPRNRAHALHDPDLGALRDQPA